MATCAGAGASGVIAEAAITTITAAMVPEADTVVSRIMRAVRAFMAISFQAWKETPAWATGVDSTYTEYAQDTVLSTIARSTATQPTISSESEAPQEQDIHLSVSDREVLQKKDFAQMSAAEIAEVTRAIAKMSLPQAELRTRRTQPDHRGRRLGRMRRRQPALGKSQKSRADPGSRRQ